MELRRGEVLKELERFHHEQGVAFLSPEEAVMYFRGLVDIMTNTPTLCTCVDIPFGSYKRTVVMVAPFDAGRLVTIDICIARDIAELWREGIKTTGSCCGHNRLPPSVVVTDDCVSKMEELGYTHDFEHSNPMKIPTIFYL